MTDNTVRNRLSKPIRSVSLDKNDLRDLLLILQEHAYNAGEMEFMRLKEMDAPNLEGKRRDIDLCQDLKVMITGENDLELFGTAEQVLSVVPFPDMIKSVRINSDLAYRVNFNYYPDHSFELNLDFERVKVFDFTLRPSEHTDNTSVLIVQGSDKTWVNGVYREVDAFLNTRPS